MVEFEKIPGFIPRHGGYRKLYSFSKAEIIFDATVKFTAHYFHSRDRTIDQMVQAARSGKQNIVEGSMASATSKETEIFLTNVARSSLEELKTDYEDFLRTRGLDIWDKHHRLVRRFQELNRTPNTNYETYRKAIEHEDPEIRANAMICLITVTCYLIDRQVSALEQAFLKEGGIREKMRNARLNARGNRK
jgi:four helix bundle suffix protein